MNPLYLMLSVQPFPIIIFPSLAKVIIVLNLGLAFSNNFFILLFYLHVALHNFCIVLYVFSLYIFFHFLALYILLLFLNLYIVCLYVFNSYTFSATCFSLEALYSGGLFVNVIWLPLINVQCCTVFHHMSIPHVESTFLLTGTEVASKCLLVKQFCCERVSVSLTIWASLPRVYSCGLLSDRAHESVTLLTSVKLVSKAATPTYIHP